MTELFGTIKHAGQIEDMAEDFLKLWTPTYLAEMERQLGLDSKSLPHIRAWTRINEFEKWPEDQLPTVLLICPGLAEPPIKDGSGAYRAKWALGVAVVVSASTERATRNIAGIYSAAIRATLLQHRSLGGQALGVDWTDERYDDLPSEDSRSLAAARQVFVVEVADVTNAKLGPDEVLVDHHDPYPPDSVVPDLEHVSNTFELEGSQ